MFSKLLQIKKAHMYTDDFRTVLAITANKCINIINESNSWDFQHTFQYRKKL